MYQTRWKNPLAEIKHLSITDNLIYGPECLSTPGPSFLAHILSECEYLLTLNLNICFEGSKDPSRWDGSFEYPQHIFWLRYKKNDFFIKHSYLWAWMLKHIWAFLELILSERYFAVCEYFLIHQLKHVLGAQKNHLIETVLLSTHNTCFGWEIRKLIF